MTSVDIHPPWRYRKSEADAALRESRKAAANAEEYLSRTQQIIGALRHVREQNNFRVQIEELYRLRRNDDGPTPRPQ